MHKRPMSEAIHKIQRLSQLHREHQAFALERPWNDVILDSSAKNGVLFRVFLPPPTPIEVTGIGFYVEDVKLPKDSAELIIRHIPIDERELVEERKIYVVKGEKQISGSVVYSPGHIEVRCEDPKVEFGIVHLFYRWRRAE